MAHHPTTETPYYGLLADRSPASGKSDTHTIDLPASAAGYVLDSSVPVAAAWTTLGIGLAYSPGLPLDG